MTDISLQGAMLTSNVREYLVKSSSKMRIVAFSWANPRLMGSYLNLVAYLRDRHGVDFYFVTNSLQGKPMFLQSGIHVFTIRELCSVTSSYPDVSIPKQDLDWLVEYNRIMNWNWFPPERVLAAYSFLLDAIQPNAVLTWNGVTLLQRAPVYLAKQKGIPTFFLERGLLPDTLVIDPQGVNYGSHIAGDKWEQINVPDPTPDEVKSVRQYCKELQAEERTIAKHGKAASPQEARRGLNISPEARIVLFPMQIETDSNILNHSPYYKKMPDIIRGVERVLRDINDVILVVKPHPEDRDRLSELHTLCGPQTRLSTDLSLHSLLNAADAVVVVNSTVGLEALTQRKPVVVLGRAIYGEKGFTFDLDDPKKLSERLKQALDAAKAGFFNEAAFYRFLVYLLKNCLFSLSTNDTWGSRENIACRIVSASAGTKRRPRPGSPVLEKLLEKNRQLMRLLSSSDKVSQAASVSILLVGRTQWLADFLTTALNHARIGVLTKSNAWWRMPLIPFQTYDYALFVGGPKGKGKRWLVWSLVRARYKISLVD